jgi:outer membrane protein
LNLAICIFHIISNARSDERIAYVDAVRLLSKYKGLADAREELNARSQTWQSNIDTLKLEFDKAVTGYKNLTNSSTAKEKQLMEELIRVKEEQLISYQQTAQEQFQKQDQELSSKLLTKMNDYIKRYGQENGYSMIFTATHIGNIAYGDESVDITDEVLAGLNAEYQKAN